MNCGYMRHRYSKRPGLQIIRKRRQIFPRLHHQWTSYSPTGPDPGKLFCADHNVFGLGQGFGWRREELEEKENKEEEEEDEKEERVLRCARKKVGGLKGLR